MALYVTKFTNWAGVTYNGLSGRASAYGMLKQAYANDVTVPNLGMNLQIFNEFGTVNFYAPSSLNDPLFTLAVGDDYEVGSSKNSINANDYVMGGGGTVTVMFEVG